MKGHPVFFAVCSKSLPICLASQPVPKVTVQIQCVDIGRHGPAAGLLPLVPWREKAGMRGMPSLAARPCQRLIDSEHLPEGTGFDTSANRMYR